MLFNSFGVCGGSDVVSGKQACTLGWDAGRVVIADDQS